MSKRVVDKQAAREWRESEQRVLKLERWREEQIELLRYAAEKRKVGYPCPSLLREVGLEAAADKLAKAYALIQEAYDLAVEAENSGFRSSSGG